jgi:drug/metabolite transporter (DMT)-like permease
MTVRPHPPQPDPPGSGDGAAPPPASTPVGAAKPSLASRIAARPLLAGAAGAFCIAFSAILVRLADVSPVSAAVFRCAYAVPVLAVLAAAERRRYGPRSGRSRRLAMLAGVLFSADLILWHHAIDYVGAGLGTVLGNLQVLLVGFVAWAFLGERPHRRVLAALPVVVGGVVLISGVVGQGAYGSNPLLGVLFGFGTGVAYAGFLLVLRAGNADTRRPAGPLLEATATSAVVSAVVGLGLGTVDLVPSWPAHGWLLLLALTSQVLGWMLISVSLPRLQAVVTSLLLMLQPVIAVGLGIVLLGEAPSPLQILGAVVVLVGVVLATTGRSAAAPPGPVDAPTFERSPDAREPEGND